VSKLSTDLRVGVLHPRENISATGNLAALNAELQIYCDGSSSVVLDLRGTFSGTFAVQGTVDGTNWQAIPMRPVNAASVVYLLSITGTTAGTWIGPCAGYTKARVIETTFTSGSATAYLAASNASDIGPQGLSTNTIGTAVGAAAAAVTLTLAAPGAGLRHYITYLAINKFASALLVAAAAPVTVTTTNLPGSLAFSFPADAGAAGTIDRWREDFAYPIAASAQNTATTIVCPATTSVIWRVTAGYFIAP
jgi:hypothetical protein